MAAKAAKLLQPLSAEELRRAALARSQARGKWVARRRLAWRWFVWGLGRSREVAWPAWLILAGGLTWLLWPSGGDAPLRKPESPAVQAMAASALRAASATPDPSPTPAMAPPETPTANPEPPAIARDKTLYGPDPAGAAALPPLATPPLNLRLDETPSTPRPRPSQAKSKPSSTADLSVDNRRESSEQP